MEKIEYAFVHFDVFDENQVLGFTSEFKTQTDAIIFLKHHPCTLGAIFEYVNHFNINKIDNTKTVAIKRNGVLEKFECNNVKV